MLKNLKLNKSLWLITAFLSIIVSLTGLINQNIYTKVVSGEILSGVISQDLITFIISAVLILIVFTVSQNNFKVQILALSFLAYIFYAYSIYAIEQIYCFL